MKSFMSTDTFTRGEQIAYLVRRPDPKAKVFKGEVPRVGELVEMDGKKIVVWSAYPMGDSEFNYWPDMLVITKDAP